MSKKLIAGAGVVASFAIALAPLATFATVTDGNAHRDTIKATIDPTCSFGHTYASTDTPQEVTIGSHTNGNAGTVSADSTRTNAGVGAGIWDSASATNYIDTTGITSGHLYYGETDTTPIPTETLWGIVEAGSEITDFGKTVLHVVCNVKGGYQITATPTALSGAVDGSIAYGYTSGIATSAWGFKVVATTDRGVVGGGATSDTFSPTLTSGSAVITNTANRTTPRQGDEYTITYGMGIAANQGADTYTGTVTYVLAEL